MKRSQRSPRSFYRVGRIRYAATVATMIFTISGVAASAIDVAAESPAVRDQAVVAQGVASVPDGDVAWTVSLKTADQVEVSDAMTGFLVADQGSLLIEEDDGNRTVLDGRDAEDGSAEALFVSGNDEQSRSAIGDPAQYLEVELVSGNDATAGSVIGDAFELTAGDRELSMV